MASQRTDPPLIETCCAPLLADPLGPDEAERLAAGFKVLAHPQRLRLISLLAASAGQEACVCELTGPLGLSQPTVSHHLRLLHAAGLVSRSRRGTFAYYRLDADRIEILRESLSTPVTA